MPSLVKPIARGLGVYLVLVVVAMYFEQTIVNGWLPLYRWEIGVLSPDFHVDSLVLHTEHGETVVALTLRFIHTQVIGGHLIPAGGTLWSSTLAGHTLQPLIILLSVVVAWPIRSKRGRIPLLLSALPFILLVELLDVPLVLMGSIQNLIIADLTPDTHSWLVIWMNVMNGGGRLALGMVGALLAVACYRMFEARLPSTKHAAAVSSL